MRQVWMVVVLVVCAVVGGRGQCVAPGPQIDYYGSADSASFRGWFSEVPGADRYLIVYSTVNATPVPVDGTVYAAGATIGSATVLQYTPHSCYVFTNLPAGIQYYLWAFPAKHCNGSPKYGATYPVPYVVTALGQSLFKYCFGNLHAHTSYSDGNQDNPTLTPADAYAYVKNSLCMDFLGISEHNHASAGMQLASYQKGLTQARIATTPNFVSTYGMEWGVSSSKAGHVLVYGTTKLWGWESNNYDEYIARSNYFGTPETTGTTGLFRKINDANRANPNTPVFASLAHPYETDFDSLIYRPFNATVDSALRGCAVESGKATSTNTTYSDPPSSMYYLEYFRNLLAVGYHVGPLVDHDNHNTTFGRATAGRLAIISQSLDTTFLQGALMSRRFYATEDCDTRVNFTLNGMMMGERLERTQYANLVVTAKDPTNPNASALIKIMKGVEKSRVLATELTRTVGVAGTLVFTDTILQPGDSAYYYADIYINGNRTITAPIWYKRSGSSLPLRLLRFTALPTNNQQAKLTWLVNSQHDVKQFAVERSADGRSFAAIAALDGLNGKTEYSFVDGMPHRPGSYYRLKLLSTDGKVSYSEMVFLNFEKSNFNAFAVSPNPAGRVLKIQLFATESQTLQLSIYDVAGRLVSTQNIAVSKGNQTLTIDRNLPKGVLIAQVRFADAVVSERFVRE